jgi:hypothetical protein
MAAKSHDGDKTVLCVKPTWAGEKFQTYFDALGMPVAKGLESYSYGPKWLYKRISGHTSRDRAVPPDLIEGYVPALPG